MADKKNVDLVEVNGDIRSHAKNKVSKLGPVQQADFKVTLDFSKCSKEDLIALARKSAIIDLQATARSEFWKIYNPETKKGNVDKNMKNPRKPFAKVVSENISGTIDVKALLANARAGRIDKVTASVKKAETMTPEQRKALAKMLLAMDAGK